MEVLFPEETTSSRNELFYFSLFILDTKEFKRQHYHSGVIVQ